MQKPKPYNNEGAKTFSNLIQEVLKKERCNQCGCCVSLCAVINAGALEIDQNEMPRYSDPRKCIKCGICYITCPATNQKEQQNGQLAEWSPPMGRIVDTTVSCAVDNAIRRCTTESGTVTAFLLYLLKSGEIDGAIITRPIGMSQHTSRLALTEQEIIDAADASFDSDASTIFDEKPYSTFWSSIQALKPPNIPNAHRIAFVGVPCQIKALRKMQALHVLPAKHIRLALGLFCAGYYNFAAMEPKELGRLGGFFWKDVTCINLREKLQIQLKTGKKVFIPLKQIENLRRATCKYCNDYSSEYADLSFGGVGAPEDWTTVIVRTPAGREALRKTMGTVLKEFRLEDNPHYARQALEAVQKISSHKKELAAEACARTGKAYSL